MSNFQTRGESAEKAARFIIAKAAVAWRLEEGDYRDDVTAIVIYITPELTILNSSGGDGTPAT